MNNTFTLLNIFQSLVFNFSDWVSAADIVLLKTHVFHLLMSPFSSITFYTKSITFYTKTNSNIVFIPYCQARVLVLVHFPDQIQNYDLTFLKCEMFWNSCEQCQHVFLNYFCV